MVRRYDPNASYQTINGARKLIGPDQPSYRLVNGARMPIGPEPSLLDSLQNHAAPAGVTPAPTPPQFQFTFDTIGQVIPRHIGHGRLRIYVIWVQGINESGDVSTSSTQTFAGAICAPIDVLEDGEMFALWDGGSQVLNAGGIVIPVGWSPADAALLATSLANIQIFPGDEAQLAADLIVADKGADKTNAFRGIRYFIFPDYPINGGGGNGIPQLQVGWKRNNDGGQPKEDEFGAVEFSPGAT